MKATIRVGVSPWKSLVPQCVQLDSLQGTCYPGVELEVLRNIALLVNVSLSFVTSQVPGCGYKVGGRFQEGSLLGLLEQRQIDMTGNLCNLHPDRTDLFVASLPVITESLGFVMRFPTARASQWFNPLAPFRTVVWLYILVTFTVLFVYMAGRKHLQTNHSWLTCVCETLAEMLFFTLQLRQRPNVVSWTCVVFLFAYLRTIYSCYIREVLMSSAYTSQPWADQNTFIQQLVSGRYRVVDYKPKNMVQIHGLSPRNNDRLKEVLDTIGYVQVSETSALLTAVSNSTNGIVAKNNLQLLEYMTTFNESSKLWKLPVEFASIMLCFFWNREFRWAKQVNQAILTLTEFTQNEIARQYGETLKRIYSGNYNRMETDLNIHKSMRIYGSLVTSYMVVLLLAVGCLLGEVLAFHRNLRERQ